MKDSAPDAFPPTFAVPDRESSGNGLTSVLLTRRTANPEPASDEPSSPLVGTRKVNLLPSAATAGDASAPMPEVGEELFGFRLRLELGRGAFARVFLAEQDDLAGRSVVLKVSAIEGSEPQTLAQLQHTNIVPIYSVHEDARAGLRAVCMPYFGGASLAQVLARLSAGPAPRTGADLLAALRAVEAPPPPSTGEGPVELLERMDYVTACAWLAARLAEGLQHAHQRGIVHQDIKPANILLSAEGQPLLLDFNLAQDHRADAGHATLGGTIAYMSPEQLRALASRGDGGARRSDPRSDVYALGVVLFEMLTLRRPFAQAGEKPKSLPQMVAALAEERSGSVPSPRTLRQDCPWGLESVVRKCLEPDPARRFQQAEHLVEDLRRLLDDRPLRFAPELSIAERARKWARRHPRLWSAGVVGLAAAVLLAAAGVALGSLRGHLLQTEEQLGAAQARERRVDYETATVRALCLVNTAFDGRDHLRDGAAACEQALGLFGVLDGGDWQGRSDWNRLDDEDRRRLAEDTRELLLLLAAARVRLHPDDPATARAALELVSRAETVRGLGESRALWLDRAVYLERLDDGDAAAAARGRAEALPPSSARDHYLLALSWSRNGRREDYRRAVGELDRALRLNPRHYWSWVQRGLCHQELGDAVAAAADFGVCVGLRPDFAWGHFARGWLLDHAGKKADAVAAYEAAIGCDPALTPARLNRGLALLELNRYGEALSDFEEVRGAGRASAAVHVGLGTALEGLGRHAEADAAFAAAFDAVAAEPAPSRARVRWAYGFAVMGRAPDRARVAFDDVLAAEPNQPQALYGRASLAMNSGKAEEALDFFDRAVEADPALLEARRYRGLLLARAGLFDRAMHDINHCLERAPASGPTLYTAACIAALASAALRDAEAADQSVDLLSRAAAHGAELRGAVDDPDLAGVRSHSAFRRLIEGVARQGAASAPRAGLEY